MLRYKTVYVSDGRIRDPRRWTTQGFTDSLRGAIRATASRLATEQYPKAMILDRKRGEKIVATLSNTAEGIHIVKHEILDISK